MTKILEIKNTTKQNKLCTSQILNSQNPYRTVEDLPTFSMIFKVVVFLLASELLISASMSF